jgi:hypothetical protein
LPHVQFRDLRRSGMVYGGELGVEIQFLTARSGHTVLGHKRTILDTYMPGNSRSTAEGVAIQWQRHLERIEQEKEQATLPRRLMVSLERLYISQALSPTTGSDFALPAKFCRTA